MIPAFSRTLMLLILMPFHFIHVHEFVLELSVCGVECWKLWNGEDIDVGECGLLRVVVCHSPGYFSLLNVVVFGVVVVAVVNDVDMLLVFHGV